MNLTDITAKITAFESGQPNTAEALRDILTDLASGFAQTGDIREIDVSNAYLTANFDASGLGINEREGWAVCNGNNGTRNRGGRVPLQYNSEYAVLGTTGGSATQTLTQNQIPSHRHNNGVSNDNVNPFVYGATQADMPGSATSDIRDEGNSRNAQGFTSYTGSGEAHNNMQPYIVSLFIQKL